MKLTILGQDMRILYQHEVNSPDDLELSVQIDGTLIMGIDAFYLDPENFAERFGTDDVASEVADLNRRYREAGDPEIPERPYFMVCAWEKKDQTDDREWIPVQSWALDELERNADGPDEEIEPPLIDTGLMYCIAHAGIVECDQGGHACDYFDPRDYPDHDCGNGFCAGECTCRIVPLYVKTEDDPGPTAPSENKD